MPRGRIPKPWLRKSTGTWFTTIDGRQVPLGTTKREAHAEFSRIMVRRGRGPASDGRIAARDLAELWLADCERAGKRPATMANYRTYSGSFCAACGSVPCRDLRPFHITQWLAGQKWSSSTQHLAITVVRTMVRWGDDQGYLEGDPLRKVKRPPMARRKPITLAEADAIMAAVRPEIRTALGVLLTTGVRPGELTSMTVEGTSLAKRLVVVGGKTGQRTVPISDAFRVILEPLLAERRAGPLFRNEAGKRLTGTAIRRTVMRARRRAKLGEHITPHCFRGLFATEGLRQGVDSALLSRLLGHRDPSILMKFYAAPDDAMLLAAANRATTRTDGSNSGTPAGPAP